MGFSETHNIANSTEIVLTCDESKVFDFSFVLPCLRKKVIVNTIYKRKSIGHQQLQDNMISIYASCKTRKYLILS